MPLRHQSSDDRHGTRLRLQLVFSLVLASVILTAFSATSKGQSSSKLAATSVKADWARFRGPEGQGTSAAKGLPLQWNSSENIAWKTEMPGPGASSPIVFGDHIYITCYSGFFVPGQPDGTQSDLKRHLVCLNRIDGASIWQKAVAAKLPEEDRIRDHGFAANTPAADADRVYCFFGKSGVIAFDHDGNQLWQTDVGSKTHGWGTSASPVLDKDLVFINASVESDSLVALDRTTGKERWRASKISEAWNTPVIVKNVNGKPELVISTQGSIQSFDPESGQQLWTCATDIGWYMVPSIVADDGVIYCLGGRSGVASLAVRTGGKGDVTKSHRLWTSLKGSNVSSPVIHDGHVYWMNDNHEIAYCAKAKTGEVVYEQRINRAGQVYASPLLAEGRIYYLTRDGKAFVVAAKPEFEQLAVNDLKDGSLFNGSFAVDGSRLLVRSDKYLYAIGQ
ncbi:MAG: PQQ-binding-like beta-propeller repeat protein [Planctomycetota bacterium]|nr:PQQ-binding-like beta-propeller repeat protein [Planctomycetota bacterium]